MSDDERSRPSPTRRLDKAPIPSPLASSATPKSRLLLPKISPPGGNGVAAHAAGEAGDVRSGTRTVQAPHPAQSLRSPMPEEAATQLDDAGGGAPMDVGVRARIEHSLGVDLGHVRVHSDERARQTAEEMGARAFTQGSDIFLGRGESAADLRLMAHEAAHVVQQSGAPGGPQAWTEVGPADHPTEHEATVIAERVVAGQAAATISADPSGAIRRAAPNPSVEDTAAKGKPVKVQKGVAFIKGNKDKDEIDPSDVRQGQLGDCWLLAGLQAVARTNPEAIRKMIKPVDDGKWSVTFQFPGDKGFVPETVIIDAAVPVTKKGHAPIFAKVGDVKHGEKELWVLLIEKAYAITQGKYNNIRGSTAPPRHESMELVTGKKDSTLDPQAASEDDIAAKLALAVSERRGVTLWTVQEDHENAKAADKHKPRIVTNHGYVLIKVDNEKKTVDLMNPWGPGYTISGLAISEVKKFFRQIRIAG